MARWKSGLQREDLAQEEAGLGQKGWHAGEAVARWKSGLQREDLAQEQDEARRGGTLEKQWHAGKAVYSEKIWHRKKQDTVSRIPGKRGTLEKRFTARRLVQEEAGYG